MVTPTEKRDPNKYCEFHADTCHSTDECMQLRKQIDEMIKAGKLSQFIKELKQNDKPKAPKKGDTTGKERPLAILMIQPWEKVAKQKVTIPTQWNNRQPGYKENPCHTIHSTWMLKFPVEGGTELCTLLGRNLDVFAWNPADMTGVPQSIAEHCLNIREGCPPVRQKKRGEAPERNKAIQEEVETLVDAGIMKEVHYHSWLSNPVMVKKHDGT
ncbi:hypothetical protein Tco_0396309 [Tanacetum coccineum]